MPTIVMRRGPEPGRVFHLEGETVQIGRGRKNDIVIHDNEVSREHCVLNRTGDNYELSDLGSSNGTFVNGQRVTGDGWLLKSDCLIEIGDSITLEYLAGQVHFDEATSRLVRPYVVVLVDSSTSGPEVYPLEGELISVGRDLGCTIVIQEPEVSRKHFHLHFSDLGYMVEDLGSTNGTRVNGEPVDTPRLLRINDMIQIGSMVRLLYTDDPSRFLGDTKTDVLPSSSIHDDETIQRKVIDSRQLLDRIKLRTETSELGLGFKPGSLAGHILVVYARPDWNTVVAPLYAFLEDHQLKVWVDQYLNHKSDEWEVAVNHALAECGVLIVVVTQAALVNDYVRRAWQYFHNREKPIILFRHEENVNPPTELRRMPIVVFDPRDPEGSYMEVVAEVIRLL